MTEWNYKLLLQELGQEQLLLQHKMASELSSVVHIYNPSTLGG